MLELRDYQSRLIDSAREHLRCGCNSVLIQSPTGSGKTVLVAHMLRRAVGRGHRAWFVVHRRELIEQSVRTLRDSAGLEVGVVAAGVASDRNALVQVCSIQSLRGRWSLLARPSLIVWDECFPAGTLVDGRPIETIRRGDMVWSFNHVSGRIESRRVVQLMKSSPSNMVRVAIGDKVVACTAGHPFYVEGKGYVPARQLTLGDRLLSRVQNQVPSDETATRSTLARWAGLLLESVFIQIPCTRLVGNNGAHEQAIRIGEDDCKQPDGKGGNAGEVVEVASPHWTQAGCSRRKWNWVDGAAKIVDAINGVIRACIGVCRWDRGRNENQGLPDSLQNRRGLSSAFGRSGIGWKLTLWQACSDRSEKGFVSSCPRVDGVTHIEPSDDGTFGGVCRDGCVYNFEVEGNNNYFVDGMLVHNCHHIAAGSWADVFRANPEARHIGLTATPERLDGVGLGRWFQRLVLGPSVADLIDGGWLAKFKIYSPPGASLSGVHMLGGDYNKRELNAVLDGSAVMGDVLTHYRKLAPGRRMVAFTWSVASSVELADRFSAAGIPAEHVDGTTSMHNRDAAMSRFRRGETMVLTNVDLFGEGLDVPAIEAVALLRPTQSLGLYVQQVGRALRPAPGKSHAIILDHAGNALRHGLPDDPRDWSLDSERRKRVGDHAAPVRQCPKCYAVMPADRPMCIECGFEFPTKSRKIAEIVGELQEMQLRRDKRMEQRKADTVQKLISIGRARGYRNPAWWAWMVFTHRRNG